MAFGQNSPASSSGRSSSSTSRSTVSARFAAGDDRVEGAAPSVTLTEEAVVDDAWDVGEKPKIPQYDTSLAIDYQGPPTHIHLVGKKSREHPHRESWRHKIEISSPGLSMSELVDAVFDFWNTADPTLRSNPTTMEAHNTRCWAKGLDYRREAVRRVDDLGAVEARCFSGLVETEIKGEFSMTMTRDE